MSIASTTASLGTAAVIGGALGGGLALSQRDSGDKKELTDKEIGKTIRNTAIGVLASGVAFTAIGAWAALGAPTPAAGAKLMQDAVVSAALLGGVGTASYQLSKGYLN